MGKKALPPFFLTSLFLAVAAFLTAVLAVSPFFYPVPTRFEKLFVLAALPSWVLSAAWVTTVVWGLFAHGRRGAYLLVGAPLALTHPVLVIACQHLACHF